MSTEDILNTFLFILFKNEMHTFTAYSMNCINGLSMLDFAIATSQASINLQKYL